MPFDWVLRGLQMLTQHERSGVETTPSVYFATPNVEYTTNRRRFAAYHTTVHHTQFIASFYGI